MFFLSKSRRSLNLKLKQSIVFYLEENSDWGFLKNLYELCVLTDLNVIVISSTSVKPEIVPKNNFYFINSEFERIMLFLTLKSKLLITTLTDLGNLQLKKSIYGTKYIYIFHSLASTTAVYLDKAFDNYDYILCAGPHQKKELSNRFVSIQKQNKLFEYGYEKLDQLLKHKNQYFNQKKQFQILIAPTWGESGMNLVQIEEIITYLSEEYKIVLRFHPMFIRSNAKLIDLFGKRHKNIHISESINSLTELIESDVLITDWSGIAIEFGLGLGKPVISVDLKQKIRNINYDLSPTFESEIRSELGLILAPNNLKNIQLLVEQVILDREKYYLNSENLLNQNVFNPGNCIKSGQNILYTILSEIEINN